MKLWFDKSRAPETIPPTEAALREDRNESLTMVLREYDLDKIRLKTKWHESQNGLYLFVRLFQCSSENWEGFHARSNQITVMLSRLGVKVTEIFYSHISESETRPNELECSLTHPTFVRPSRTAARVEHHRIDWQRL